MIEPKDGDWWLGKWSGTNYNCVMQYNGKSKQWHDHGLEAFETEHSFYPLYKVVKAEESKPRTKTVYEKVEYEKAWEAIKYFEDGGELWTNFSENGYRKIDNAPDVLRYLYKLYKTVEKDIDWKDEVKEFLSTPAEYNKFSQVALLGMASNLTESEFINMCHLVASLTDKPEWQSQALSFR